MKRGTTKTLRVSCVLLVVLFFFCAFALLPQPVQATNTTTVTVGSYPFGVAVTPNGAYAYVTNQDTNSVSVISTSSNTVTETVTVGSGPFGVAVTPNGAYAYVTNLDSGSVSVINTATNTVVLATATTTSTFWSQNQLTIVSVAVVVMVGALLPAVYYRRMKPSRRNLCIKLVAKGEELVKKNELQAAVECFVKASIVGFKTKSIDTATKALERYIAIAKSLVINSVLSGFKTEAFKRISKLQSEIAKNISNKNMQALIGRSSLEGVWGLDLLFSKAVDNDLDFLVDEALKTPEIEQVFLGAFRGLDEVLVGDLAAKLGYSVESTFKLMSKGITLNKIEGYITIDGKKFVSKEYVRKQLSAHLKYPEER